MANHEDEHGLTGPDEYEGTGNDIGVRPQVDFLETFLDDVHAGRLRIPKFQRPFVWRPEQMLDLFDSIERGYPIGSLLLWKTSLHIESLDHVGALNVPDAPGNEATYVLDGHQRISTLYSCLYWTENRKHDQEEPEWVWQVYRILGQTADSRTNRYVHWKRATPPPPNYLPVASVRKTLDFLSYARELAKHHDGELYDALVEEAENVAQRIKSYKISVVTLLGGNLAQAVEVFSRVNSKGQAMSPDQMVSALTYKGGGEESLANRINTILERIAAEGFGEINSTTAFRAVLAVAGEEEVTGAHWDVLARRVEGKVSQAIEDTDKALSLAVEFLRHHLGVPLARLIPYNNQLMLLTLFFHLQPYPHAEQVDGLTKWFWITSWSGQFASMNSTTSRQAIQDMRAFALGEKDIADFASEQGMFDFADQRPRPFPDKFDLRSARVRAYLLWELQEFPVRYTVNGVEYSAIDMIRKLDTAAFRRVSNATGLTNGSSPANRVVLDASPGMNSKEYMLLSLARAQANDILCVSKEALTLLAQGDDESFINLRAAELAERERRFIANIAVTTTTSNHGGSEIDTE
ncbi:hypothetical protein GCM10009678_31450 [Actinomadura kijaniata]|uniref:GmrSD restriction endonucleases N-terminal domain-containing protein n=1 Tax=Actinomadura namibiensis TaxID=182080 RepID=A0A7W3LIJ2_ACTNM|nr:DUF262 domain-containing protein [Actinomadura namibiensis]MBA8948713.1 hypothetical protein [Actinomadura namibiensis]